MNPKEKESRTFNGRFYIKKKISAGSFGVVFICQDSVTQDHIALKIEKDEGDNLMSLERETQILQALQGVQGVPKLLWHGFEHGYNCMAISLLGRDLAYHLRHFRKFTLKCVCNIADQLISLLENIHRKHVIHRDIKPENILTGRDIADQGTLYFVDFGISKMYREADGQHIPLKENKPFIGTTRYASIAAHKGYELSRKDDLESLGYVLLYLLKGILPWQNIQTNSDKEKTKLVGQMKMSIELSELCKDVPQEFQRYFDYCKKLSFKTQPDYKYLQTLFQKMAINQGLQIDKKLDWMEPGTTTTKSQDTQRRNSRIHNRAPSSASSKFKEKRSSQNKKPSYNDLSGSSLFSQGDFLKPPRKSRERDRHREEDQTEKESHQSSVHLNYVPSIYNKSGSQILNQLKSRQSIQHHLSRGSQFGQSQSQVGLHSMGSGVSSDHKVTIHDNSIFNQLENFQDLEELENILAKDRQSDSPQRKSKKNIIVKGVRQPDTTYKFREPSVTINFEDFLDDDPKLSQKLELLKYKKKLFKESLADR